MDEGRYDVSATWRERRVVNTIALMSVLVWGGNMLAMQAEHEVVSTATVCPATAPRV